MKGLKVTAFMDSGFCERRQIFGVFEFRDDEAGPQEQLVCFHVIEPI